MFNVRKSMKLPLTILTAVLFFGNLSLQADCCGHPKFIRIRGEAAPEVKEKIRTNKPFPYRQIYQNLVKNDNIATLGQDLTALYASLSSPDTSVKEAAYMKLFNDALSIITNYCPSQSPESLRVVVTAANGLVVVDTDLGPINTLENFLAANLGSGFNSRIAILDAQAWPAGVGVETQFDLDPFRLAYGSAVAVRLGPYLNNPGTVRLTKF
jgi:hypothetical protein